MILCNNILKKLILKKNLVKQLFLLLILDLFQQKDKHLLIKLKEVKKLLNLIINIYYTPLNLELIAFTNHLLS